MSLIKDALKKAKMERQGQGPFDLTPEVRAPARAEPSSAGRQLTRVINYSERAVKKHHLITPYLKTPEIVDRFRFLKTKVFDEAQANDDRNILITSSQEQEGKTFTAINLAITVAREVDQTVLLVDVNYKHPSVLDFLGIKAESGLSDFLLHDKPLTDLLVCPGIEKLVILPAGQPLEHSAEHLRSVKMQNLVQEMKNRYAGRYIFFDAPPVLGSVDTMVLARYVDKIIFVVGAASVPAGKVSEALQHLEKEKVMGTVLNKKI